MLFSSLVTPQKWAYTEYNISWTLSKILFFYSENEKKINFKQKNFVLEMKISSTKM